jgi:hypothetical protein
MLANPIRIYCLEREQFAHIKPVEEFMLGQAEFIYADDFDVESMLSANPDFVLCVNEYRYEIRQCLAVAREAKIPSLTLQDGVLEWRCQYENPIFGIQGSPQHQPVLADKIACIGPQSARQISFWGNSEKVEITGMPRLVKVTERVFSRPEQPGKRILVMTAKKPWFTDAHREITLRSLFDIKAYFDEHPEIEVVWRLTKNVSDILKVDNQLKELSSLDLADVLENVDAVISTVSTAILEAMLAKRPVAALDYHNVPRFLHTSWTISSCEQIQGIVSELQMPSHRKMAFQDDCLHDSLRLDVDVSSQVAGLISKMAIIGRKARMSGEALAFPVNICNYSPFAQLQDVELAQLYPENPIFQERDIRVLQSDLASANLEISRLKYQLSSRHANYWIQKIGSFFYRFVSKARGKLR